MNILDLIAENDSDASETLTPPGCGGNITQPEKVRDAYAGRVAMIGGMDQFNVLTNGTRQQIRSEVLRLFEEGCARSAIQGKITLDTSSATVEETIAEFVHRVEPHLTDTDRSRILVHRQLYSGG